VGIFAEQLDDGTQSALGSGVIEIKDGTFAVPESATRQTFANPGATETTIANLPGGGSVPVEMEVAFIRSSDTYAFRIVPDASESITFGGNVTPFHGDLRPGDYMELGERGTFLVLKRTSDGNWTSIGEGGVLNPAPPPYPQFLVGAYVYQGLSASSPDGVETDVVLLDNSSSSGHRINVVASNYLGNLSGGPSGNVYSDGGANIYSWDSPLTVGFRNYSTTTLLVLPASALLRFNFDIAVPPCPYALNTQRLNDIVVPPTVGGGWREHTYFVDTQGSMYLFRTPDFDYTYEEASFVNGPA
jgi:hypothetical protein